MRMIEKSSCERLNIPQTSSFVVKLDVRKLFLKMGAMYRYVLKWVSMLSVAFRFRPVVIFPIFRKPWLHEGERYTPVRTTSV